MKFKCEFDFESELKLEHEFKFEFEYKRESKEYFWIGNYHGKEIK